MATIYIRGKYYWIGYYDNKWIQKSLHLPATKENKIIAEQIRLQKELDLKRKQFAIATSNLMLSDAYFQFMMSKNIKQEKQSVYYSAIKSFSEFLGKDIFVKSIRQAHLKNFEQYLKKKEKSPNTIFTYLNHLSIFSRWLLEEGFIENDFSYKSKPFRNQAMIIPDLAIRKLLLYLYLHNKEQYYFINFLYLTGFRKSEALRLKWQQIDFNNDLIYVENSKAKRTDVFPIYPKLKELLKQIPQNGKTLFTYSKDGLKFYNRALERLKLNHYSLHDLRRKFGTMMAEKGLTPYELQKLMRHENIKTTMQYYVNVSIKNIGNKL